MAYRNAERLMLRAEAELNQVTADHAPESAFLHAHMAALRAAAAVVEVAGPMTAGRARRRVRSVWEQLAEVPEARQVPETRQGPEPPEAIGAHRATATWQSWSMHFAQQAAVRAAIESGRPTGLTEAEAETAVGAATDFLAQVREVVRGAQFPIRMAS